MMELEVIMNNYCDWNVRKQVDFDTGGPVDNL